MAIQYLNSIDLNKNELQHAVIENQTSDANAATGVAGQIYYNTADELIKVWDGTLGQWKGVGTYDDLSLATASITTNVARVSLEEGSVAQSSAIFSSAASDSGLTIAGSDVSIAIAVNYASGSSNVIHAPGAITALTQPNSTSESDYILTGQSDQSDSDGPVKKIRLHNIPVSVFGNASKNINLGGYKIENVGTPTASTDAATKSYVDNAVVGALSYQGAYNPVTNTPDLDRSVVVKTVSVFALGSGGGPLVSTVVNTVATTGTGQGLTLNITLNPAGNVTSASVANGGTGYAAGDTVGLTGLSGHSGSIIQIATIATAGSPGASIGIEKGWTYTVIADGDFYGEKVRVGDVLIAESDDPGALANWTTVQNNIDLASDSQVGIGNVIPNAADAKKGISVSYSNGTASVGLDIAGLTTESTFNQANTFVPVYTSTGSARNRKIAITDLATEISESNSAKGTIAAASTSGTITHNLGTYDVIVQLFDDVTKETIYADVDRSTTNAVVITFGSAITNAVRVLVQKIA